MSEIFLVQLIEPNGDPNIKVDKEYAINYCKAHPGWSWREISED